jgi:serine phosphatase RsbU (regulator of sigma subunit)
MNQNAINATEQKGSNHLPSVITNILFVEDDHELAMALQAGFGDEETSNFIIEPAVTLEEAINLLGSGRIDIVLLDLNLPDSRGLETFSKIQRIAPELPIIILSGLSDEELAVESVRAGAQDYFVKGSMSVHVLVRAVRYALERMQLQRQLSHYACQLRLRNEVMEAELRMARDVQRAYLPLGEAEFPRQPASDSAVLRVHSRFLPAAELGGDFFDVLEVSDRQIGVFICDVMGHGVSAGLVAGIVRGLIEEARPNADDAGAFLTDLNRGLRSVLCHNDGPIFATAFYAVADLTTEKLCYASAGHPAPLLFDHRTGTVESLAPAPGISGPALGLFGSVIYEESKREFRPNDLLVLYTDGLSDVTNSIGTTFGNHRLFHAVRQGCDGGISELFDFLLSDAHAFSGGRDFEDDVCILGVQMLSPSLSRKTLSQASADQNPTTAASTGRRARSV